MTQRILEAATFTALATLLAAACRADDLGKEPEAYRRTVLPNGATVVLLPIAGADLVAVETFYPAGAIHEPDGIAQAAHLLEHLACRGATRSFAAGESFERLNRMGTANAETLLDFAHYDYLLPAAGLETALRIEAERLGSLRIAPELIRAEAARCRQEAVQVEGNPAAGMLKFAFMAMNQAWRHGKMRAQVKSGFEEAPAAALESLHSSLYRPETLLIVAAGAVDVDQALELARERIGELANPENTRAPPPIAWEKLPRRIAVEWESRVRAVSIAYPPPAAAADRLLLALWGGLLMQELFSDAGVKEMADATFTTTQQFPPGALPFFIYAAAKDGADLARLEELLAARVESLAARSPSFTDMLQLRAQIAQLARPPAAAWKDIQEQARQLAALLGTDPDRAAGIALGNFAIQAGMRERLLGPDAAKVRAEIEDLTAERLQALLHRCLAPEKRIATRLTPSPTPAGGGSNRGERG